MAPLFASTTGILGVLACMRCKLSNLRPDNGHQAANLLGASLGRSGKPADNCAKNSGLRKTWSEPNCLTQTASISIETCFLPA